VGGFPYAAAFRLVRAANDHWYEIDGQSARNGVDPAALPFRRFLTYIYALLVENLEEDKRARFDQSLFAPVTGKDPDRVDPVVVQDELALFRAAQREAI
jgi:hypothetical protein